MNVFEDLIEELKEENLLESTVIETNKTENYYEVSQPQTQPNSTRSENKQFQNTEDFDSFENNEETPSSFENSLSELSDLQSSINGQEEYQLENDSFEFPSESVALKNESLETEATNETTLIENLINQSTPFSEVIKLEEELQSLDQEAIATEAEVRETQEKSDVIENSNEKEQPEFPEYELLSKTVEEDSGFYRRRANEEVTSLQIVEHIISAIEKEHMKIVPQAYDDLPVSMALHDFLQAGTDPLSTEHTQAEFKLMQETEKWYSALAQRDNNISVGDLRRYMENAKPALSSQALISLARFYRNSPFSEAVRSKFDLVITKLVTRENWDDTRISLFTRDELIKQLGDLYSDWSSIPLYENNQDDSDVLIGVLKFDDFIDEVNNAETLDELIKSDFFNRVKAFKESTNEKFFAPLLISAAVECNVIVGNKYVKLVKLEKTLKTPGEIEEKYNFLLDQPVSDTVSKSLKLVEILKEKKEPQKLAVVEQTKEIKEEIAVEKSSRAINAEIEKRSTQPRFSVNKWLVAVVVLALFGLGGLYSWAEFMTPQMKTSPSVRKPALEPPLSEYFKTARINRDTMFLVTQETWDKQSKEIKENILKNALAEGKDKGYNKIHVLDKEGKTVSFASEKGISTDTN